MKHLSTKEIERLVINGHTRDKQIIEIFVKSVAARIYLAMRYAESQFLNIKGYTETDIKQKMNHAINSIGPFIKKFEGRFTRPEKAEDMAGEDTELMTQVIDACIAAEENGMIWKFKNDFNRICKENGLNV
jgi:hypothetical protein